MNSHDNLEAQKEKKNLQKLKAIEDGILNMFCIDFRQRKGGREREKHQ